MEQAEWPSAVVALGLLALITAVGITAIVRYNVEQALKIWSALAGITGVVTGAFVTYFFTRQPIKDAREQRDVAMMRADDLETKFNIVKNDPSVAQFLQQRAAVSPVLKEALKESPSMDFFTKNDRVVAPPQN